MVSENEEQKWVDEFAPKTFEEIVGQDWEKVLLPIKEKAQAPKPDNMIFYGPPGCGKNTTAACFARLRYKSAWRTALMEVNASDERGIQKIRELKSLTTTQSKLGDRVVNLTECDSMTKDAMEALRRVVELSKTTIFIFDCNDISKMHPAILSRCANFRFEPLKNEDIKNLLVKICVSKNITQGFKDETEFWQTLDKIANIAHGDARKAIEELRTIVDNENIAHPERVGITKMRSGEEILQLAKNGDFHGAKRALDITVADAKFNWNVMIDELKGAIGIFNNQEIEARLFVQLRETINACAISPQHVDVHLTAFIAYAHQVPHILKKALIAGEII